jgi:type VI secretion system protein ImpM
VSAWGLRAYAWPFLTAACGIATKGRAWPVQQFVERVQRLRPEHRGRRRCLRLPQWLAGNSMKALWETGFGSDASRYWVLSSLIESVEPFRGRAAADGAGAAPSDRAGDAYATRWTIRLRI